MSFVPNRDLKRLNPMSNDCRNGELLCFFAVEMYNLYIFLI